MKTAGCFVFVPVARFNRPGPPFRMSADAGEVGLMQSDEPPSQIEAKVGIKITKVEIQHDDPTDGLFEFGVGPRRIFWCWQRVAERV